MTAIAYPDTVRNFQNLPRLNSSEFDTFTQDGSRISLVLYIDVPTQTRKELLNRIRTEASKSSANATTSRSVSGITVENSSSNLSNVESYIGMTLPNLRNALFARGGLHIDFLLKLQSVAGMEVITAKDIEAAWKARFALVKDFIKEHSYNE